MSVRVVFSDGLSRAARIIVMGVIPFAPVALVPAHVVAQVAVVVPADALAEALSSCTTEVECLAAIEALVEALAAANPGVPIADIIGSVAAAAIEEINAGTVPAAVGATVLNSAAAVASSAGATELSASLVAAAEVAATGAPVDVSAVALGSGSPT